MRQYDYNADYNPYVNYDLSIIPDTQPIAPVFFPATPPGFTHYPKRGISQAPTSITTEMRTFWSGSTKIPRNRKKFAYLVLPNPQEIIIPFSPNSQFWPKSRQTPAQVTTVIGPTPNQQKQKSKGENKLNAASEAANKVKMKTTQQRDEQQVPQSEAPFIGAPSSTESDSTPRTTGEGEKIIMDILSPAPTQLTAAVTTTPSTTLSDEAYFAEAPGAETQVSDDFAALPNDFKNKDAVTQGYVFNDQAFTGQINFATFPTRKAAEAPKDGDMLSAIGNIFNAIVPGG